MQVSSSLEDDHSERSITDTMDGVREIDMKIGTYVLCRHSALQYPACVRIYFYFTYDYSETYQ